MSRLTPFLVLLTLSISISLHAQPTTHSQGQYKNTKILSSNTRLIRNDGINAMRNAIMGDTLSDGSHPDRIYVLQRGQRYINSAAIITKGYHLRIEGEPARYPMIPALQLFSLLRIVRAITIPTGCLTFMAMPRLRMYGSLGGYRMDNKSGSRSSRNLTARTYC